MNEIFVKLATGQNCDQNNENVNVDVCNGNVTIGCGVTTRQHDQQKKPVWSKSNLQKQPETNKKISVKRIFDQQTSNVCLIFFYFI